MDNCKKVNGDNDEEKNESECPLKPNQLRLYKMVIIPKRQRLESAFSVERQQKGVRIVANASQRIGYIQSVQADNF